MNRPSWESAAELWEVDGSLRDLYVQNANLEDWKGLIRLAGSYDYKYSFDGVPGALPDLESIFTGREGSHLLSILVGSVFVNCHFFGPREIELDIDPYEIKAHTEHELILEFIERLGLEICKPVLLTPENHIENPFLTFDSSGMGWAWHA